MLLARNTHTQKKSVHTSDEEPLFINCKNCVGLGTQTLLEDLGSLYSNVNAFRIG